MNKLGLDKNTLSNYRPISNLSNISKLLERVILSRMQYHTTFSCNFNHFLSAYRRYYSTESALLLALDNIYHAIDEDSLTVWYYLILALHSTTSITPLSSVDYKPASAYLDSPLYSSTSILRGAVNLSVLAVPRLQLLCAPHAFRKDLSLVLCFFHIHPLHILSVHMDYCVRSTLTSLSSVAISKDNYDTPVAKLEVCLSTLHTWFCYNGWALNPGKSEAIVLGTTQRLCSLPITFTVNVAGTLVQVSNQARILGVTLYSTLPLDAHSHLMHTSLHFQNPVSVTSVHSVTSVSTSH